MTKIFDKLSFVDNNGDKTTYKVQDSDAARKVSDFQTAQERANISSGDEYNVIYSKLSKWYTDFKPVVFSGSYNDLEDKPTIPTVNDGTLSIKVNNTLLGTFSANAAENTEVNITMPVIDDANAANNKLFSSQHILDLLDALPEPTATIDETTIDRIINNVTDNITEQIEGGEIVIPSPGQQPVNLDIFDDTIESATKTWHSATIASKIKNGKLTIKVNGHNALTYNGAPVAYYSANQQEDYELNLTIPDFNVDDTTSGNNVLWSSSKVISYVDSHSSFSTQLVQNLPNEGEPNVLYLVAKTADGQYDSHDEYMWINNTWENIGKQSVDTSGLDYIAGSDKVIIDNVNRTIDVDPTKLPQPIEYTGEGGVVVNNTTRKISLEDGIITQPADPNHDNNYYIYNGVKVTVPQGRGYILLRNNYNLPEGADPSFYEAGLYIEDENIDAPTGCESITVARFQSSDFPYIIDEPEYLPHDGSNDTGSDGNKIYSFSFLSSRHDSSSPTYGLMSYYMNVIINRFGSRDNTAANPTESLFKIGDFCYDNFGNLYKILSVTKISNNLRIKFKLHRAALQSRSNYYNSYSSMPSSKKWSTQYFDEITWEENRDNGDWYDWNNHWDSNTGTSVSEEQFYSDEADDKMYPKPDDENWSRDRCNGSSILNTYGGMAYSFRGAYKNPQTNKVFYLYGTPNDVVAICCYLREMDNGNRRPAFAGFITFGTPFSLEQPLDRHDEDTEVQAYNWTEPRPQIKFIDATTISGALANIDTTTYQADDIVVIKNPGATLTFPEGNSTVTLHNIPFEPQFRWNGTEFKPMFYFIN